MIQNQQRQVRVKVASLGEFLARACRAVKVAPDSLTVCLVNTAKMTRWNRTYRGKRGPTDVLSFPSGPADGMQPRAGRGARSGSYLGDIAICPAVARRNALNIDRNMGRNMGGRTLDSELRILILHGILHLMGYDHETD